MLLRLMRLLSYWLVIAVAVFGLRSGQRSAADAAPMGFSSAHTHATHHAAAHPGARSKEESNLAFMSTEEVLKNKAEGSKVGSKEATTAQSLLSSAIHFLSDEVLHLHKRPPISTNHSAPASSASLSSSKHHATSSLPLTSAVAPSDSHELQSPSHGTTITPENLMGILQCPNQSKCIVPELQLQVQMKVYFCKHRTRHGVRYYYLAREGLLLHPKVELVTEANIHSADYIVYLPGSTPWHLTECNDTSYAPKLIVLDEFDGPSPLFVPAKNADEYAKRYGSRDARWYYLYFKRSFVRRHNGVFASYPHMVHRDVYPLTYSVAEAYIPHMFNFHREIEVLCTLRGHARMQTRLRVQEWVALYGKERNISNVVSGQVSSDSRPKLSVKYFQQMFNSKIIVTVNPSEWEGDFRLWESLSTGALVFVDPLFVPHPFPLVHEEHVIFFSNVDKDDLFRKLDYYREHPDEARRIAYNGYQHALKHHRTVSMIDYVLRTAHLKSSFLSLATSSPEDMHAHLPKYYYSGQYLNKETRLQEKMIKKCNKPGLYETGELLAENPPRLQC